MREWQGRTGYPVREGRVHMGTDSSKLMFDAAALKREFPGLADPQLHYLDSAATAGGRLACSVVL